MPGPNAMDSLVCDRDLQAVSFEDWLVIKDLEEKAAIEPSPRKKFCTVESMLEGLNATR